MMRVTILCTLIVLVACEPQILKDERVFIEKNVLTEPKLRSFLLNSNGVDHHFVQVGESTKPAVVFIHGTPGSWSHFGRFLMNQVLLKDFQLVSVDRPGWGESLGADSRFLSQASHINTVLAELRRRGAPKIMIVGHSLGASLAPTIAMNHPDSVDGLVLLAGTLAPDLSKPRWYNRAASLGLIKVFLSSKMLQANAEIDALEANIKRQAKRYHDIEQPLIVVQGNKDKLVSPANGQYAERVFTQKTASVLRLENRGHLFLFKEPEVVINAIQSVAKQWQAQ